MNSPKIQNPTKLSDNEDDWGDDDDDEEEEKDVKGDKEGEQV